MKKVPKWHEITSQFGLKENNGKLLFLYFDSCECETTSFSFVQGGIVILSWNNGGFKMSLVVYCS